MTTMPARSTRIGRYKPLKLAISWHHATHAPVVDARELWQALNRPLSYHLWQAQHGMLPGQSLVRLQTALQFLARWDSRRKAFGSACPVPSGSIIHSQQPTEPYATPP